MYYIFYLLEIVLGQLYALLIKTQIRFYCVRKHYVNDDIITLCFLPTKTWLICSLGISRRKNTYLQQNLLGTILPQLIPTTYR